MHVSPPLPPCASWKLWHGAEVEGTIQLGEHTLFVREASAEKIREVCILAEASGKPYQRIWFCKEYIANSSPAHITIQCAALTEQFKVKLAFEIRIDHLPLFQSVVRRWGTIYVKIPELELQAGDHVCVGPAFADEAFCIGTGIRVTPLDYAKDENLLP